MVVAAEPEEGGVTGPALAEGHLYAARGQAVEYALGTAPAASWLRRL